MTILFLNLQIIKSDIGAHIKLAVSLVIALLIFLGGLCRYVWVNILPLSPPREELECSNYRYMAVSFAFRKIMLNFIM